MQYILNRVRHIFAVEIIGIDILRQSTNGKNGAKEALFGWYVDNQNEKIESEMTIVILLSDTASAMQIAGLKEFDYDRVGCAACFQSKLWHRSAFAAEHTTKLSLFCKKIHY